MVGGDVWLYSMQASPISIRAVAFLRRLRLPKGAGISEAGGDGLRRWINWFLWSGAVILFVLAAPLLLSGTSHQSILTLEAANLFLFVSNRVVLCGAGGAGLLLSGYLLLSEKRELRLALITWFACDLALYQLAARFGEGDSFGCLAHLTNRLPVPPLWYDGWVEVLSVWLALGGAGFMLRDWLARCRCSRKAEKAPASSIEKELAQT